MANKLTEYNRGRQQGLEMAYRLLCDAGETYAAGLIQDEIRMRGRIGIPTAAITKELEEAAGPIKVCMYESFLCMTLMVLRDQFEFGQTRCQRFVDRWKLKEACLADGLVNWRDQVEAVKNELGIDIPTEIMKENQLI